MKILSVLLGNRGEVLLQTSRTRDTESPPSFSALAYRIALAYHLPNPRLPVILKPIHSKPILCSRNFSPPVVLKVGGGLNSQGSLVEDAAALEHVVEVERVKHGL